MRVLFNPTELVPAEEEAEHQKSRGHVISPDAPFTNIMALRELLRSARGDVRWYEPHLSGKALEVLAREVSGDGVKSIRLLSGPANVTGDLKDDYKRFRKEMKDKRGVDVEWRILTKKEGGGSPRPGLLRGRDRSKHPSAEHDPESEHGRDPSERHGPGRV